MSYSHTTIIGNLGRDPELKTAASGTSIAKFSVAVTLRDETHWYRCVAFGKTADFVGQYLTKGRCVAVGGTMKSDNWEDKEGNKRISWELAANTVQAVGARPTDAPVRELPASDGDIPF